MSLDTLAPVTNFLQRRQIHAADKHLRVLEKAAGAEQSAGFNQAIHKLFNPETEIVPATTLDDLNQPIMAALSAGFEFSHEISKDRQDVDKTSHIFLDAMAFLNRKEVKFAKNFFDAIRLMADIEQIQAVRDFSQAFEKMRQKSFSGNFASPQGEFFLGLWKTYNNLGGVELYNQLDQKMARTRKISKFIVDKATLAVK